MQNLVVSGEVNLLLLKNEGFEVQRGRRCHGGRNHIASTERGHGEGPELEGELGGCGGSGCGVRESEGKELQRRKRGEEEGFAKFKP